MTESLVVKTTRKNWFEDHPKYLEIKSFGYDVCLREAMLIYLDLIEVKHWFDVEICRCDEIKNVYIVGRPLKKCQIVLVVPIASTSGFTHVDFRRIIKEVHQAYKTSGLREQMGASETKSVYIAIMDSSSTVVYYKMTDGLVAPEEVGDDDAEADSHVRWTRNNRNRQKSRIK